MEASRKHGFQVYGAPTSDSIAAIKDISFATAKALVPSADDKALAAIIDTFGQLPRVSTEDRVVSVFEPSVCLFFVCLLVSKFSHFLYYKVL